MMPVPVIIVQGGAGSYEKIVNLKSDHNLTRGMKDAAAAGYKVLMASESAVAAVEAAVCVLEDNEYFNAGRGSHLTTNREVEMDASIMDGSDLRVGGVTCITNVKNPVKLAHAVMDKSNCILMAGEAAEQFAKKNMDESEFVANEYFKTPYAKSRLEEHIKELNQGIRSEDVTMTNVQLAEQKDTVGAVALDKQGNVAFATSTGGILGKLPGRVGDSPIVGAGGYADNESGATSTTGTGEQIAKVGLAKHICFLLEQGKTASEASEEAISYMKKKVGGYVGVVTISKTGETAVNFNSQGMAWAMGKDNTLTWGIVQGEENKQNLT